MAFKTGFVVVAPDGDSVEQEGIKSLIQ